MGTVERDIKTLIEFFSDQVEDGDILLYSNGVLATKGCNGDYGCCSKVVDIEGILSVLQEFIEG